MSNEIKDLAQVRDPVYAPFALRRTRPQRRFGPGESLEKPLYPRHPFAQFAHLVPNLAHVGSQTDNLCPQTDNLCSQAADLTRLSSIDVSDLVP